MTSNPAIFEKAIDGSNDYAAAIEEISNDPGSAAKDDLRAAGRRGHPGRRRRAARRSTTARKARDGYVSLEVSPDLAHDTRGHAGGGAAALDGGGPAQRDDQGAGDARGHARHPHADPEGINVNVTLLFAREAYEAVA